MIRILLGLILSLGLVLSAPVSAQDNSPNPPNDRTSTGGAQNLQDILDRQNQKRIDDQFRRDATGAEEGAPAIDQLGTLGGASDSDIWRAYRYGSADVRVSGGGDVAKTVMQSGGMWWLKFRATTLHTLMTYSIIGILVLLALFYLIRGKIRISGGKTGRKVIRFKAVERLGHWTLAISFILLALTGLFTLFGRQIILPLLGREAFSTMAIAAKWIHNNVAWAFIIGLVMIFVFWVKDNFPDKTDIKWIAQGGGIFNKNLHPPAKKFNAGQKVIFWSVVIFGTSVSVTGVSLLFPFQIPLFGHTFEILNAMGLPQLVGFGELNTALTPQEDMQFAHVWHALLAGLLIVIVIAHIYIGSVGMEGAFSAVGTGEVEEQWAREHHSLWVEQVLAEERAAPKDAQEV
ncbi:formate dehydrogenase subunit gamma [Falsihalocynthiibacter sp. SS001]|uniref:formate dehydrogenase subunit gamma n=1 Tax=Falsihalocynthiibacter sp. SS001 TaxID=3349698 RepID=UPI0036D29675